MLIVNEKFGRFSGAEQNIIVTVPYIRESFRIHFLYEESTDKGTDSLKQYLTSWTNENFHDETQSMYRKTLEFLKEVQPQIIYVHKCMNVQMLKAFRAYGVPLIRMQHDHDMYCMRSYKYNPLTRHICTKKAGLGCIFPCMASVKRDRDSKSPIGVSWVSYFKQIQQLKINLTFDEVFVVTDYMKNELINQGFKEKQIQIFPPVPPEKTDLPMSTFSDENIIIFATQIIRGKGLDCLIQALGKVKEPFKLFVFGEGSHKSYCQDLTKELSLEEQVIFKGFVSQDELSQVYQEATMGTVPSVWPEPIATVGLEFFRHGLPVIGFDSGGIKDWLKDGQNGFLIDWMNIDEMALRIDELLANKDKAVTMGRFGKDFVNAKYNFKSYILRLVKHLENLVEEIHFEPVVSF
jgi:glycosyltransferase involved in cell wall biosynthesis